MLSGVQGSFTRGRIPRVEKSLQVGFPGVTLRWDFLRELALQEVRSFAQAPMSQIWRSWDFR